MHVYYQLSQCSSISCCNLGGMSHTKSLIMWKWLRGWIQISWILLLISRIQRQGHRVLTLTLSAKPCGLCEHQWRVRETRDDANNILVKDRNATLVSVLSILYTNLKSVVLSLTSSSLTFKFWPSKGSDPLTSVYKITPKLHTSTSGPSYFLPTIESICLLICSVRGTA